MEREQLRMEQQGGHQMVQTSGKNLFKKVTISVALAGAFAFTSFVIDFDSHVASASQEYNVNQILKVGSRGAEVTKLQKELKAQKHFSSKVDGIYGPLTKNAVVKFQQKHNLQVDGIAGPQTLRALNHSLSATTSKQTSSTVLRNGSRGQAVKDLQSQLKKLNYYKSAVDGIYGSQTMSAVRAFQRDNGLADDGIAGSQTFAALKNPVKSSTEKAQVKSNVIVDMSALVKTAKKYKGVPYKWGGTTPKGFDCSGFINYVFKEHGISLPRTVASMWSSGTKVNSPSVGDIVFFNTSGSGASHAGIYIGNNEFIHAGSSTGVTIANLNNSYWKPRYLGAKKLH